MRSYPHNSPKAAARIVALALIADGHLSQVELDALDHLAAHDMLGLTRVELHGVVHGLCEDLLIGARADWADACQVDERTLGQLMAEIDDPVLRSTVLRLCVAVVESDALVVDAESLVLVAAVEHWGLQQEMLRPVDAASLPAARQLPVAVPGAVTVAGAAGGSAHV
jgi:hypothetical protein